MAIPVDRLSSANYVYSYEKISERFEQLLLSLRGGHPEAKIILEMDFWGAIEMGDLGKFPKSIIWEVLF